MDKLLYTAVSGANRSLSQQQIHANNLANSNTQGFRADLEINILRHSRRFFICAYKALL
ncbi:flagella basal body rod family protein, partial [Yersinia pestis PY-13]